jgi:hypothetical protein
LQTEFAEIDATFEQNEQPSTLATLFEYCCAGWVKADLPGRDDPRAVSLRHMTKMGNRAQPRNECGQV